MYKQRHICAVIPARDEALSITRVLDDLSQLQIFDRVIVCDNGSTDATATLAASRGAEVISHAISGYGAACLTALTLIEDTDIVVFIDADDSLVISEALDLLDAIVAGADLSIGVRKKEWCEPGSMTLPQQFGNRLAAVLIKLIWQHSIADLGPFRAIRFDALQSINMQDRRFGWTVEMQIKVIQSNLIMAEVPVHYRRRLGLSKISGTLTGVIGAGIGIISMIIKLAIQNQNNPSCKAALSRKP